MVLHDVVTRLKRARKELHWSDLIWSNVVGVCGRDDEVFEVSMCNSIK